MSRTGRQASVTTSSAMRAQPAFNYVSAHLRALGEQSDVAGFSGVAMPYCRTSLLATLLIAQRTCRSLPGDGLAARNQWNRGWTGQPAVSMLCGYAILVRQRNVVSCAQAFLAPPWGGPSYLSRAVFSVRELDSGLVSSPKPGCVQTVFCS